MPQLSAAADPPLRRIPNMQVARVKKEKCSTADCNRCIRFCPVSRKDQPVIYIGRNKKATVNEELCNGCGKCVRETPEEKTARKKSEHGERVIRTLIACVLGMIAGITSYFIAGTPSAETGVQADPFIGILILLVAIVLQRTIFILLKIDTAKLGKKDWFYQAFMTFAMWYLSWTIILSTSLLAE